MRRNLSDGIDTMNPNGALEESGSLQDQAGIRDIST